MAIIKKHMSNTSGTVMPTFKLRGANGIELISAVVKGSPDLSEFRVKAGGTVHKVAYYDTHIESTDIESIKYTSGPSGTVLQIYFRVPLEDGRKYIELPTTVNSANLALPEEAEDGDIAIYGKDEDGKTMLKTLGMKISNNVNDIYNGNDKTIPTSRAISTMMNDHFIPLEERAQGNNVSEVFTDISNS